MQKKEKKELESNTPTFQFNDGGREESGYKGFTGDCVTRAIAIASGFPYQKVYDDLFEATKTFAESKARCKVARSLRKTGCSPRKGVFREIYEPYLRDNGFEWVSVMGIGKGCTIHVKADELPKGNLILRLSKHLTAFVDGVLQDTYDCSREGTRCVYGYFIKR